jgi:hypothetical protein
MATIGETQVGVILMRFQITAKLIMRWQFRGILCEFLNSLESCLLISQILFIGVFLFLAKWKVVYFLKVSIMGWKLVVSM